MASYILHLQ